MRNVEARLRLDGTGELMRLHAGIGDIVARTGVAVGSADTAPFLTLAGRPQAGSITDDELGGALPSLTFSQPAKPQKAPTKRPSMVPAKKPLAPPPPKPEPIHASLSGFLTGAEARRRPNGPHEAPLAVIITQSSASTGLFSAVSSVTAAASPEAADDAAHANAAATPELHVTLVTRLELAAELPALFGVWSAYFRVLDEPFGLLPVSQLVRRERLNKLRVQEHILLSPPWWTILLIVQNIINDFTNIIGDVHGPMPLRVTAAAGGVLTIVGSLDGRYYTPPPIMPWGPSSGLQAQLPPFDFFNSLHPKRWVPAAPLFGSGETQLPGVHGALAAAGLRLQLHGPLGLAHVEPRAPAAGAPADGAMPIVSPPGAPGIPVDSSLTKAMSPSPVELLPVEIRELKELVVPLAPLHSEVRELKQHVMPLTPLHSEIRELKELVSALSDEVRRLQTKPTPSKRLRKRSRARLGCCCLLRQGRTT